jgi:hypothetical protein
LCGALTDSTACVKWIPILKDVTEQINTSKNKTNSPVPTQETAFVRKHSPKKTPG